jgi:hypothetical protein
MVLGRKLFSRVADLQQMPLLRVLERNKWQRPRIGILR